MNVECYAATRPQENRNTNEDAFLIAAGETPLVVLCDGAGEAELAAKKVTRLFQRLVNEAKPEDLEKFPTWNSWTKVLDSSLLGGSQSTFIAAAILGNRVLGAYVGDSRAYLINRDGECQLLTQETSKFRLGSGKAQASPIHLRLEPREVLLFLSDGAWTPLSPYQLNQAVAKVALKSFSEVPEAVLDAANRNGRSDDMTAIALRLRR